MLADGVFETVYSDGHHTIVNYTDKAFSINGYTVPANDLLLFQKSI